MNNKLIRYITPVLLIAILLILLPVSIYAGVIKENYNTGDDNQAPGYGSYPVAQTFTAASDYSIASVKLRLYKEGSPGTIYLVLKATSSSHPTGGALATGTMDGNTLTTNTAGDWYEITFSSSYSLTSGTKYALVLNEGYGNSSNRPHWRYDGSSSSFANGAREYYSPSTWYTDSAADFMFENYSAGAVPTVTTQAASSVSYTTATGNGNVTNNGGDTITEKGICYSISTNPPTTTDSTEHDHVNAEGAFTESLTSLSPGTLYYARAYAINSVGTAYGSVVTFTTLTQSPTVTTAATSDVEMTKDGLTAGQFNGELTDLGDDTEVDVSFIYGSTVACSDGETTPDTLNATGTFNNSAEFPNNWTPGATYYYKSKAVNDYGTSYGSVQSIALTMPTVTTLDPTVISPGACTAILNGNVGSMGVATSAYLYFEYGDSGAYGSSTTSQEITIADDYTDTISGFLHNITMHYRVVVEVDGVVSNGADKTFLIASAALTEVLWYQPITIIVNTDASGTVDSGSTTTLVDAALTQANDYWNYALLTITDTTDDLAPKGETAVITDFVAASDELQFAALTQALEAGDTYTVEFGTLPDRDSTQDGIISWGVNPNITITNGLLMSNGSIGVVNRNQHDAVPALNEDMTGLDTAQTGNILFSLFSPIATMTNFPLWVLFMILGLVSIVATMMFVVKHTQNQMLGAGAGLVVTFLWYKMGVFDWWMFIVPVIIFVAVLVMERKTSL